MSTKAIREVLERAGRMWEHGEPHLLKEVKSALAEVEAIERAAADISEHGTRFAKDESMDLIQAIAEQD